MRCTSAQFRLSVLLSGIVIFFKQPAGAQPEPGELRPAELSAVMKLAAKQAAFEKIEISADSTTTIRVLDACPAKLNGGGQTCYEVTFNQGLRPRSNSQEPVLIVVVEPISEKATAVRP